MSLCVQRKFDEGGPSAVAVVFLEILDNIIDLMVDPFGNYLVQKLLDRWVGVAGLRTTERGASLLQH